jgi:hypothetical protein
MSDGMVLAIGPYKFPVGAPKVSFLADAILNAGEQVAAYKARVDIVGKLISNAKNPQQDLDQQIGALIDACSIPNQNCVLYLSDGVTPSQNVLLVNQTLGGIRIVRAPSFPDGGAAEYVTQRSFSIALEAELPTGQATLWSFKEQLAFEGGGRIWDILQPLQGDGVPQTIKQKSPYRATQTGEAVGYRGYWPNLWPGPKWPNKEQEILRVELQDSPQRIGTSYKLFPTRWTYHFLSVTPLKGTATPSLWPL